MINFINTNEITVDKCLSEPNALFVFEDNLESWGKAGQAVIRDCFNSIGIPTKREPLTLPKSFFSDREDEYEAVKKKLIYLWEQHKNGKIIYLPNEVLGIKNAKLHENSLKIYMLIDRFYQKAKFEANEECDYTLQDILKSDMFKKTQELFYTNTIKININNID